MYLKGVSSTDSPSSQEVSSNQRESLLAPSALKTANAFNVQPPLPPQVSGLPQLEPVVSTSVPTSAICSTVTSIALQSGQPVSRDFEFLSSRPDQPPMSFKDVIARMQSSSSGSLYTQSSFNDLVKFVKDKNISFEQFPLVLEDNKGNPLDKEGAKRVLKSLHQDYATKHTQWPFIIRQSSEPNYVTVDYMDETKEIYPLPFEIFKDKTGTIKILMKGVSESYIDLEEMAKNISESCEVRAVDLNKDIDWDQFAKN